METQTRESVTQTPLGSFEAFYRRWYPSVSRSVALVVRDIDHGQELAREAFTRLWNRWDVIRSEEHARNFAFQVALNLARSHLRGRRPSALLGLERHRIDAASDAASDLTDRIAVLRALGSLSIRQRECVVLVDYLGYDAADAAAVLDMKPATVRVRVRPELRGRVARAESARSDR